MNINMDSEIYNKLKYDSQGFRGNVKKMDSGLMAYQPATNSFLIGPEVRKLFDEKKLDIIDFAALHEDDHRRYAELTAQEQQVLHQSFLEEMQNNPDFWKELVEFAEALYQFDSYFYGHQQYQNRIVENPSERGIKKHPDGSSGVINLKLRKEKMPDRVYLDDGEVIEMKIHIGLLITELLSYMSVSQRKIMWKKLVEHNINFGGMADPAKSCREKMSPELKKVLVKSGFGINRPIPDWRKNIDFT